MKEYRYRIDLKVERRSSAKYLNDHILAGKNKGYTEFLIAVSDSKTYSNICAPIAGILDHYKNAGFDFKIEYENSQSYAAHTKFDSPQEVEAHVETIELKYPFNKVWKFSTSEGVNALVSAYILAVRQEDIIGPGVVDSLEWCLNETMDNVLQHSEMDSGYVMMQLHKKKKQLSVCIFDRGIGIYNSLKTSKHHPATPLDAITLALQEKVTRDEKIGQGKA